MSDCGVFSFQAEDGIRNISVTGVQTCALPICASSYEPPLWPGGGTNGSPLAMWNMNAAVTMVHKMPNAAIGVSKPRISARSEERRVGEECRCRRAPYH